MSEGKKKQKKDAVEEVAFKVLPAAWKRIRPPLRAELTLGLERVRRIRADIAGASRVGIMPCVRGVPEVWAPPDRSASIDGMVNLESLGGVMTPMVFLSAQTLACRDDRAVRRILVHEFAHVFDLFRRAVDIIDSGAPMHLDIGGDPENHTDETHDAAHSVDPHEWFSAADAKEHVGWHDPIAGEPILAAARRLVRELPVLTPDSSFNAPAIGFLSRSLDTCGCCARSGPRAA